PLLLACHADYRSIDVAAARELANRYQNILRKGFIMSENHGKANEHMHDHVHGHAGHHACANLFGCGDEKGTGIIREDIKDAAFDRCASDRLLHMDEIEQQGLDGYLSARGRWRRKFLRAS